MKKIIALALTAAMAISMVACSSAPASSEETTEPAATYKVGMGVVVGATEAAADAAEETDGQSQINTTVALVVFDAEDKVVSAEIDVAQQTTYWDA